MKLLDDHGPQLHHVGDRTIGHAKNDHEDLLNWATRSGNLDCLSRLVLISEASRVSHLGICLHFLAKPTVGKLLYNWQDEDRITQSLNGLAEDIRANAWLLSRYPTVPTSKPLAEQFYGEVDQHPVLLMLAVRRPGTDPDLQDWFDALRLWTVLQALRRQHGEQSRDELIDFVAAKLRLAADTGTRWLSLVNKIRGPTDSEGSISRHLRWASERWVQVEEGEPRRFLQRLGRVANGDTKSIGMPDSATGFAKIFRTGAPHVPQTDSIFTNDFVWDEFKGTEDQPARMVPALAATIVEIPKDASSSERSLTGRGVLLRTAEQIQFLPWSWQKPTPLEMASLSQAIEDWEESTDTRMQVLGFLTRVAIFTSRSMRLVLAIRLSHAPTDDWTISPDLARLLRKPPRRSPGWSAEKQHLDWIRPLENFISIDLPRHPWHATFAAQPIKDLDELWGTVAPEVTAEEAFNSACRQVEGLRRLSSGQLGEILAHSIYEVSKDAVLAQVLTARPRTGMGGNCAYASWPGSRVNSVLRRTIFVAGVAAAPGTNAAGSELDPLDEALRQAIAQATERIQKLSQQPEQWIEHHNALTIYVVTALLAASGARPVNDPFESPAIFDWQKFRVFLADKTTSARAGRLVPLPASAIRLVTETYLRHLQALANHLQPYASPLASEIARLANREESHRLPLFFLLRDRPCLSWDSVTGRSMENFGLFSWPLPANLMRHRLSIRLREEGIDAEIIDALLGHADHGVLTHGDESPRTWLTDMRATQPTLDDIYARLGFSTELPVGSFSRQQIPSIEPDQLLSRSRAFGSVARAAARQSSKRKALKSAMAIIRKILATRPPESLTPAEWDAIAVNVLTIDGKHPHPFGPQRYELLQRWQAKLSQTKKLALSHVFVVDKEIPTPFTEKAVRAESVVAEITRWFADIAQKLPPSKTGARHAIALATLDLLITCRVTAPAVLADLMRLKNVRVVVHQKQAYLEHHPQLSEYPDSPVTRYRIPLRCAQWIDMGKSSSYALEVSDWPLPEHWVNDLTAMHREQSLTMGKLVSRLTAHVQQHNYLDRPGLVAAYLAGRLACSALPHAAWLLQTRNVVMTESIAQRPVAGEELEETAADVEEELLRVRLPAAKRSTASTGGDREEATALLADFRSELADFGKTEGTATSRTARRDLVNALKKRLDGKADRISSAIWGYCAWIITLTGQPRKKNTPYAISSILRYLSATGQRFLEVGSEFDLFGADSDALTDFYDEILEMNRDLDLQYVMDRLRAFHRFMCREYAIEDADWDELDSGSTVPHGSPGTLGRPQYDNALKLLADRPSKRPYQDVACAALLILAFRFGLRGNDAIGLLRRDCWSSGKMIVLLVRPNRLRQLKRTSSRRVVPLIESLSKREIAILLRFRDQVLGLSKDNEAFALFGLDQAGNHFDLGDLRKRINTTLQFVCDDKAITLHKARHAFACRIAEYLLGLMLRAPPMHGGRSTEIKQIEHIQNLLLSTVQPTRRSCWAVSRLLGHWRPRTSFKSYVHQLPEWADTWSQHLIDGLDQEVGVNGLSHAVRLDDAPYRAWEPILTSMTLEETDAPVTPGCVAAYLDLLRRGASHASAKRPTRLSRELAEAVEQCLEFATEKVRKRTERLGRAPLISLLHQISDPEWSAIIERCGDARSQWNVANFSSHPETMGTGMQLLSENRQLVMWREWHFKLMASFIQLFGIGKGDVCIARTGRLHLTVMQWLTASKLEEFCSTDGVANLQIDAVEEGDPPRTFPHRCSVFVRPAPSGFLKTGFGLALLWVIFVACNEVREKANPNTA